MLIKDIAQLLLTEIKQRSTLVLAIDGRCAAGKTTLAARLAELCDCNVIHMDHFFLCSKQNTMERLQQAGGNMDYVRFCEEILIPLHEGRKFSYGEDGVLMFQERWIPMENTYFHSFRIQEKCDLYFKT